MEETSKALQGLFYQYTHLLIGGKEIVCPYWMNNLTLRVFGPYGGKGTSEQVVESTLAAAEKEGFDLTKMTEEEILDFMGKKKIGVDCSGFVFWMLDALDREKGGNGIADDIPNSAGHFLAMRANVEMLSNNEVSLPVELADVRVGDMIRLNGGKHLAIVLKLVKDGDLEKIEYAHSSKWTKISGVHVALIKVINPINGCELQEWEEQTRDGENYGQKCFLPQKGDGIRRLKIFA